jgi:hypothetical protein
VSRTFRNVPRNIAAWCSDWMRKRMKRGLFPTKGMMYGKQSSARERGVFVMDGRTEPKPEVSDEQAIREGLDGRETD